jgi:hypothetical protein
MPRPRLRGLCDATGYLVEDIDDAVAYFLVKGNKLTSVCKPASYWSGVGVAVFPGFDIPATREVILYCTCTSEFTSVRVALALQRSGVACFRSLARGLRPWRERGFQVTSEIRGAVLPGAVRA